MLSPHLPLIRTIEGYADALTGIPRAWRYFRDQIEAWITDEGEVDADQQTERLRALKNCVEKLIYVVAINLDETDNAQVIFETLNARGTGLGALDLIKNTVSSRRSGRKLLPTSCTIASGSQRSSRATTGLKRSARAGKSVRVPTGS
jgi:hypothetical protein